MKLRSKLSIVSCAALVGVIFLFGVTVRAQSGPPSPPAGRGPNVFQRMGPGRFSPDDVIGFVGFEGGLGGSTVTGAPFTANYSQEITQVFADGNRIQRNTTGTISRDSNGRTRRDFTLPAIGELPASGKIPHLILITDPVAGADYALDPDRKIGRKITLPSGRFEKPAGPPPFERGLQSNATTTSLGTQIVNGISAQGTRTTRTIPAGAIGNEKPITIAVERWYSPDLQMNVMIKRSDPQTGENLFQLTNIVRSEPDTSLFQVPSDYRVKEDGRMGHMKKGPMPPPPPQN
jgi:hypothetical protein